MTTKYVNVLWALLCASAAFAADVPARRLMLENAPLKFALLLPAHGGNQFSLIDKATGFEAVYRQNRVVPTTPADGKLVRNKRKGTRSVWLGEAEPRSRLKWSIGFSLLPDRPVLQAENVWINRGPHREAMTCRTNVASWISVADPGGYDRQKDRGVAYVPPDVPAGSDVLNPYEMRRERQYWFFVKGIGGVKHATIDGAVNMERLEQKEELRVGFHSTRALANCTITVRCGDETVFTAPNVAIDPQTPWCRIVNVRADAPDSAFTATLADAAGAVVLAYTPAPEGAGQPRPSDVPPAPEAELDDPQVCQACLKGDWQAALARVDAALGRGVPTARLHVLKAYVLRRLGQLTASSKELRRAAGIDPLDAWGVAERAFLEDDGGDAVLNLGADRGRKAARLLETVCDYWEIGAWREIAVLCDQASAVAQQEAPHAATLLRQGLGKLAAQDYAGAKADFEQAFGAWDAAAR